MGWANTGNTANLRDHLNQKRWGFHACMGPNIERSQMSGTNGQGSQAIYEGQVSIANPGNHHDEVVRQAVNRINDLCDEQGLPCQGFSITDDADPFLTREILAGEFSEDFKMSQIKAYNGKTDLLDHIKAYWT